MLLSKPHHARFLAFLFAAGCVFAITSAGLLILLLTALLAYQTVRLWSPKFLARIKSDNPSAHQKARTNAGAVLGAIIVAGIALVIWIALFAVGDGAGVRALFLRASEILQSVRASLPAMIVDYLPHNDDLLSQVGTWIKEHASMIGLAGLSTLKAVGLALLGALLGVMVSISETSSTAEPGPVGRLLHEQVNSLRESFWLVATAQVKIAAINTAFISAYLYILLPIVGIELHMRPALVGVTFVFGLLPIVGNIAANTMLTVLSLEHSLILAVVSLTYAFLIHKLEYFWSGRIIGAKVDARVWELIASMVIFEHALGTPGLVVAPIFYTWLKSEWKRWDRPFSRH